jgi:branched-chain amino acid transport system ATP-binding protein
MAEPVLALDGIETCYGLSQVLFGVSLAIAPGEMVTLMGRNGMGKTTTVRSIMGLTPARAGAIRFMGGDIRGLPSYKVAQRGIGLVPEGRQIFPNLSVRETCSQRRLATAGVDARQVYALFPRSPAQAAWAINCPAVSSRCLRSVVRS